MPCSHDTQHAESLEGRAAALCFIPVCLDLVLVNLSWPVPHLTLIREQQSVLMAVKVYILKLGEICNFFSSLFSSLFLYFLFVFLFTAVYSAPALRTHGHVRAVLSHGLDHWRSRFLHLFPTETLIPVTHFFSHASSSVLHLTYTLSLLIFF